MQGSPKFGVVEERSAVRLIELALAEDLAEATATNHPSIGELSNVFSVTTIDTALDQMPDSLPSELDRDLTCAALIDPAAFPRTRTAFG